MRCHIRNVTVWPMKKLPFSERPTWQRVKDGQEAAHYARESIRTVLGLAPLANVPPSILQPLVRAAEMLDEAFGWGP